MKENDKLVKISESDLAKLGKWYSAARTALEKAYRIDEVLKIKNMAEAVRLYALQERDTALQSQASEISLRAQKRGGAMLAELEKSKGGGDSTVSRMGKSASPYKDVLDEAGLSYKKAAQWQQVAAIPDEKLEQAIIKIKKKTGGELTKASVIREVIKAPARAAKQQKIAEEAKAGGQALPTGTLFPVILCDAPWQYDFAETESRAIENQYRPMRVEELCAGIFDGRDVRSLFAKDAAIFFWATAPKLREALRVIDVWGFEYKTNFVWDKEKIGMGYWCRGQHEHLLVATRGNFPPPDENLRISSVIREARTGHSEKPIAAYKIIEKYFPDLPKLELFGREGREDWVSWGNQLGPCAASCCAGATD